ncbi:hypothetical protein [uncultured Methanobrevibacter sp.]|uniref:hypothetical protein n=1 Tax=uncultured Methanobrevibacter sp. TaxID=253161 RepID=UPI0026300E85|nr:hypothetical protein [uncultured Methanobrevibacter sp.]
MIDEKELITYLESKRDYFQVELNHSRKQYVSELNLDDFMRHKIDDYVSEAVIQVLNEVIKVIELDDFHFANEGG